MINFIKIKFYLLIVNFPISIILIQLYPLLTLKSEILSLKLFMFVFIINLYLIFYYLIIILFLFVFDLFKYNRIELSLKFIYIK